MARSNSSRWLIIGLIVLGLILDVDPLTLLIGIPVTAGGLLLYLFGRKRR